MGPAPQAHSPPGSHRGAQAPPPTAGTGNALGGRPRHRACARAAGGAAPGAFFRASSSFCPDADPGPGDLLPEPSGRVAGEDQGPGCREGGVGPSPAAAPRALSPSPSPAGGPCLGGLRRGVPSPKALSPEGPSSVASARQASWPGPGRSVGPPRRPRGLRRLAAAECSRELGPDSAEGLQPGARPERALCACP